MGQVTRTNNGLTTTLSFTNAQVLTLPTTPLQLLAGVTGKIWLPTRIYLSVNPWFADYTNIDVAAAVVLQVLAAAGSITLATSIFVGGIFARGSAGYQATAISDQAQALIAASGQPINLVFTNGASGNLTGGNAGNVLRVRLYYNEYTLP